MSFNCLDICTWEDGRGGVPYVRYFVHRDPKAIHPTIKVIIHVYLCSPEHGTREVLCKAFLPLPDLATILTRGWEIARFTPAA